MKIRYPGMGLLCIILAVVGSGPASPKSADTQQQEMAMPELHKIHKVTLGPSYSCRSQEEFEKGTEHTGLFLSKRSMRTGPELLFQGACRSQDYLQVAMGGDNMSLIADLGEGRLEDATAHSVLARGVHYETMQKIHLDHIYAVVVNDSSERALFVFTITGYIPNERLDLKYVVKQYQFLLVQAQSDGFDWSKPNSE